MRDDVLKRNEAREGPSLPSMDAQSFRIITTQRLAEFQLFSAEKRKKNIIGMVSCRAVLWFNSAVLRCEVY